MHLLASYIFDLHGGADFHHFIAWMSTREVNVGLNKDTIMTNKKFPPRVLALLEEALRDKWQGADGRELAKDLKSAIKWINERALLSKAIPEWQPIEMGPDNEAVLAIGNLFNDPAKGQFFMVAKKVDGTWFDESDGCETEYLTHWMPLPAAPSVEGEGA